LPFLVVAPACGPGRDGQREQIVHL